MLNKKSPKFLADVPQKEDFDGDYYKKMEEQRLNLFAMGMTKTVMFMSK